MSEALKVPGLVGIRHIWEPSEPHTLGQTTLEVAENWCPVRFWPKVHRRVWDVFQKNWIGLRGNPLDNYNLLKDVISKN